MSKTFEVAEGITIEALGPDEAQDPLIYVVFDDYPEQQFVPVFAGKIKALIAALTEAAVWLADRVGGEELGETREPNERDTAPNCEGRHWVELKTIRGYGPYAYERWFEGGHKRSRYIGKVVTA